MSKDFFSQYHNKKIGIFGLSRTGAAVYQMLKKANNIICFDDNKETISNFTNQFGTESIVNFTDKKWRKLDILILSPGIPLTHPIIDIVKQNNTLISSDIELLFEANPQSCFIGITGTNGKTTTTSLIDHIFKYAVFNYPVGGNIGIAALSLPLGKPGYILELSSFQLELLHNFKAKFAVLLNITEDHLNRHGTMKNYINAKKNIFANLQAEDYGIINYDNQLTRNILEEYQQSAQFKLISFSTEVKQLTGVTVLPNQIIDNIYEKQILPLPENIYLSGRHNRENIAASYAVARLSGIPVQEILMAISDFQGLPHRMQYIGVKNRIGFYNDSKATNVESALQSLAALDNIYWLAGGDTKMADLSPLVSVIKNIKNGYFYGKDGLKLMQMMKGEIPCEVFDTLDQAFAKAYDDALADKALNKNLLLAPVAASTDQFKNFEHRGEYFMKLCVSKIND